MWDINRETQHKTHKTHKTPTHQHKSADRAYLCEPLPIFFFTLSDHGDVPPVDPRVVRAQIVHRVSACGWLVLRTQNTRHRTQDTGRRTQDTRHRTQDIGHRTHTHTHTRVDRETLCERRAFKKPQGPAVPVQVLPSWHGTHVHRIDRRP